MADRDSSGDQGVVTDSDVAPVRRSWMRRHRLKLVVAAVALTLIVVAVSVPVVRHRLRYGAEFGAGASTVRVEPGDRFSLTLFDRGSSVGDRWTVRVSPNPGVARLVRSEQPDPFWLLFQEPAPGCCSGTRYVTFDAVGRGETTTELYNCFQGCRDAETLRYSKARRWNVIVK